MGKWEELANNCPEYIIEAQIERRREKKFMEQIEALAAEGMTAEEIALKLGLDKETIEEMTKEGKHGKQKA